MSVCKISARSSSDKRRAFDRQCGCRARHQLYLKFWVVCQDVIFTNDVGRPATLCKWLSPAVWSLRAAKKLLRKMRQQVPDTYIMETTTYFQPNEREEREATLARIELKSQQISGVSL